MFKGGFIQNLPKIYGLYTGGFIVFILMMAIAEQAGVTAKTIGILFVAFTVAIYALIGYLSRTVQVDAYYLAGRQVPTVFNGMATAADWMSGASFVALAGGVYFGGYSYMAFLVGWTGGYVLVSTLLAPYLRKFGCYTVPDFIGTRYGGNGVRFCAVLVLVLASFTYVTAQINATGTIAARALGIPFEAGVWVGLVSILLCSMLGGMRAVTWTQVAQYIVLIIAYLIPVFWISNKIGAGVFPHLMLGDEVARITELEGQFGLAKNSAADMKAAGVPGGLKSIAVAHAGVGAGGMAVWKYISLAICMMVGTASLPHILMRYFTTPSVKSARKSVAWSLFFIFLLYSSAPMLATLSKISLMDPNLPTGIIGKSIADVQSIEWVKQWSSQKQVFIADFNGDGILQLNEWFMRTGVVVLATPEVAGLPYVISGLVAAGGMAAARGGEKHDGVGHLLRSGHAMAEWDELLNAGASTGGVVEGVEPCLILRRDAFGGEHAVHTDMVRRERDGPFAGESVHGTLSGGVSGGLALTGGGDFGADVDDGALVADEFFAAKMREGVNVRKIQVHGSHEFFRGGLQIFAVVVAGIVDEDINTAVGG